jgi:hypothetical protein
MWPNNQNLKEFLTYGAKYDFPLRRGGEARGVPAADPASPRKQHFPQDFFPAAGLALRGRSVRGIEFSPLFKHAPQSALRDPKLYELLALVDAIREGRARKRGNRDP